jgi:hypothetical protein
LWVEGETLYVVYSLVGEAPERLWIGRVDLRRDWREWRVEDSRVLLEPEMPYEGAGLALERSNYGAVHGPVRQLRDPGVFEEDGKRYLLWSVAGETGIAMGELRRR